MNLIDLECGSHAADAASATLRAPFDTLGDAALLAHYRAERAVRFEPVVDAEETRAEKIEALLAGRFEFNGESYQLDDPIDWLHNPSADVEWHIVLHKFYYAPGLGLAWQRTRDPRYARRWMSLIESWMQATPPGFIAADVTGRRVQNWIYSLYYFVTHDARAPIDPAFLRRMLCSLHGQVEYLVTHLTPKRNHRTLELYAIFLAGVVLPEFERAAMWRAFAMTQTLANIAADLLPDGVHCELSTDYHHLALRNWLTVRRLAADNAVPIPTAMDRAIERALEFSMHVHKPDGIVPSLSDGDARGYLELLAQGAALYGRDDMRWVATRGRSGRAPSKRVAHFGSSGYSIVRSDWGDAGAAFDVAQHLVFDCGPLGEGNHGHFDCLSFELAAYGRSLVVDPGRYTYSEAGATNWRVHFRGTAAHNTVCIDGHNQTRYVPKPIKERSRHATGAVRHKIAGAAPGAAWIERHSTAHIDLLHGRCTSHEYDAIHERVIVFVERRYWIVSDRLRAHRTHDYALRFQLGPQAQDRACIDHEDGVRLRAPGIVIAQPRRAGVRHALEPGWVSPRYGIKHAAPAYCSTTRARDTVFDSVLLPWVDVEPEVRLEEVPVDTTQGVTGSAIRLRVRSGEHSFSDVWFHAHTARARTWRIDGLELTGRWAHWRAGADGSIERATSHPGARLLDRATGAPIALDSGDER